MASNPMANNTESMRMSKNFSVSQSMMASSVMSMGSIMESDVDIKMSETEGSAMSDISMGDGSSEEAKSALMQMKAIEAKLRKEAAQQKVEMEKLKKLNKQLVDKAKTEERKNTMKRRSSSMSPMPPQNSDWQAFEDDEGKTYYYNTKTFECTYTVPTRWG